MCPAGRTPAQDPFLQVVDIQRCTRGTELDAITGVQSMDSMASGGPMLSALTTTFFAATTLAGLPALPDPVQASDVSLSINDGGDFRPGDRVNIEVEVGDDGHLVVFR